MAGLFYLAPLAGRGRRAAPGEGDSPRIQYSRRQPLTRPPKSELRWSQPHKSGRGRRTSPKIAVQDAAINSCQLLQIGDRRALVDLVHGLADQAKLDHRTIARDKARVRGAAGGAQLRFAAGDLFDRSDRQISEGAGFGD